MNEDFKDAIIKFIKTRKDELAQLDKDDILLPNECIHKSNELTSLSMKISLMYHNQFKTSSPLFSLEQVKEALRVGVNIGIENMDAKDNPLGGTIPLFNVQNAVAACVKYLESMPTSSPESGERGMCWVKASERLPPTGKKIIIKDTDGTVYQDESLSWDKRITDYEWLEETPSSISTK